MFQNSILTKSKLFSNINLKEDYTCICFFFSAYVYEVELKLDNSKYNCLYPILLERPFFQFDKHTEPVAVFKICILIVSNK